jgi:nucleoside-diphosphate kinase
MLIERTYTMLKPGVLQRRIAGEIVARTEHKEKAFFGELASFICSGPVVAMAIEAALPGTIREFLRAS